MSAPVDPVPPAPSGDDSGAPAAPAPAAKGGLPGRLWRALRRRPWEEDPDLADLPEDADGYVPPRRRTLFPPSMLVIFALCLTWLALEPTADLPYALLGAGEAGAIDLGRPGDWRMEAARDGARVRIAAFASGRRGKYQRWMTDWEVVPLAGLPVLVRRAPTPKPPPHAAEYYQGEGRLMRLDDAASSMWIERLFRPAARYTNVKTQFTTAGELPAGRTAWLLLEGELPRTSALAIAGPLLLWAGVALCVRSLWRAWRPRRS